MTSSESGELEDVLNGLSISDSQLVDERKIEDIKTTSHDNIKPYPVLKSELTTLSNLISDLQSSLYEIQERRHSSVGKGSSSSTIDQLLQAFDASLEDFSKKITSLTNDIESYKSQQQSAQPTLDTPSTSLKAIKDLDKKLKELQNDWSEMVESDELLREELREDKWLEVFRTAADQADGMMDSLQKAVSQCSAQAYQITTTPNQSTPTPTGNIADLLLSTLQNYEAKKKFYHPSVTKSLGILEKGIRDRVTMNGEVLRRQSDMQDRWRNLRDEMALIDNQIPELRKRAATLKANPVTSTPSTTTPSSSQEMDTEMLMDEKAEYQTPRMGGGYPAQLGHGTASAARSRSRSPSTGLSPEISVRQRVSSSPTPPPRLPSKPTSGFSNAFKKASTTFRGLHTSNISTSSAPSSSTTPAGNPPSSPASEASSSYFSNFRSKVTGTPQPSIGSLKPRWNASPKVSEESSSSEPYLSPDLKKKVITRKKSALRGETIAESPSRVASPTPSAGSSRMAMNEKNGGGNGGFSISRTSFDSTGQQQHHPPIEPTRRPISPATSTISSVASTAGHRRASLLPVLKHPVSSSPSRSRVLSDPRNAHAPPVPPLPDRGEIDAKEARLAYLRSTMQTPEPMLRERATQMPFYSGRPSVGGGSSARMTPSRFPSSSSSNNLRLGLPGTPMGRDRSASVAGTSSLLSPNGPHTPSGRMTPSGGRPSQPPSSFRDPGRSPSRAMSRAGAATPSPLSHNSAFIPNKLDELDMELAKMLDAVPNDLHVERLDPPLRKGQIHTGEWQAQYAFTSGRSGRKVYPCRLLDLNKPGTAAGGKTRKVMARVNGTWVDLRLHILNLV